MRRSGICLFLVLAVLGSSRCGKSLNQKTAEAVRHFDGLNLKSDAVEVVQAQDSGDAVLAEIKVTTAVRLVKEEGRWKISEIRLGDRRWEKADHILSLLEEQRTETTSGQLQTVSEALSRYQQAQGGVPQVQDYSKLMDLLFPTFLKEPVFLDAWSNPFDYSASSASSYHLRSAGIDGKLGTPDDLVAGEAP